MIHPIQLLPGRTLREEPSNPLELSAAPLFAVLFVAISIASTWAADHFGAAGLYVIAAIVGVTDIDPFVLGMLTGADAAVGVLTATASNNLLKAAYTVGWCWCRPTAPPVSGIARQHPRTSSPCANCKASLFLRHRTCATKTA